MLAGCSLVTRLERGAVACPASRVAADVLISSTDALVEKEMISIQGSLKSSFFR